MNHALRNHNTLTAIEPAMGFCNKISNLVSGALIVLSLVVWAAAIAASGGSWWLQFVFSGSAMLLLSAAFAFEMNRRLQEERSVMRYLDALCRASGRDSSDAAPNTARFSYCWLQIVRSLEELATSSARRVEEAEDLRARAEVRARRLESERRQMSEILTSLSDPVLAIDHYDELLMSNTSAQELFGINIDVKQADCEQRFLNNLVRCEQLVELLTDTRRRKSPAQRTAELEVADNSGARRWFRVQCRSLNTKAEAEAGPQNGQHGAVAVLTDISNEKAIQQRNAEFVSAVSHEMKTPLSGIKAYVELLADGDAEDEKTREQFLGVINGQADRLQRLIDNLLNLARIEAGVVSVNKQPQSLNELLEEALGVVQPAAEQKQIELLSDLSPMYLGVLVDRDMMLQAAINLLSNAIKYTDVGGKVTLRSRTEGADVVFEVEDTGVGLSPEDCLRVFEKFYRVKQNQQMAAGTGLGLPLARHIAEDVHGGKLAVSSVLGAGSVFRITLAAAGGMKDR